MKIQITVELDTNSTDDKDMIEQLIIALEQIQHQLEK
jgi:hypothetical protein